MTVTDRFLSYVSPEPMSGCWLWMGSVFRNEYGKFKLHGRTRQAHRAAYELLRGPIPEGLVLDHLCRVRCCVNPAHLEAVTIGENIRRGCTGVKNYSKTRCPQGHPYSATNTYTWKGQRHCKTCKLAGTRRWKRRLRNDTN